MSNQQLDLASELSDNVQPLRPSKNPLAKLLPGSRNKFLFPRANSTSTVYATDTMAHPDHMSTIKEVSKILHKWITHGDTFVASSPSDPPSSAKHVLNRRKSDGEASASKDRQLRRRVSANQHILDLGIAEHAPSALGLGDDEQEYMRGAARPSHITMNKLVDFFYNIHETAQCSEECVIVSFIYIERLVDIGGVFLTSQNWQPVIMTSMLLASKVWDDLSMINEDFSAFMNYDLDRVNAWEVVFLSLVQFNVRVSASQYAKHYFDLRKSAHRAGKRLSNEEMDIKSAHKLEALSSTMQQRLKEMGTMDIKANASLLRRSISDCETISSTSTSSCSSSSRYSASSSSAAMDVLDPRRKTSSHQRYRFVID